MNQKIKKICCIGAGYVGGPTMAVIADKCPDISIYVVDINKTRISSWNSEDFNDLPIYEPGLSEIVERCRDKNLFFTSEIEHNIREADMIFISVNTPTKTSGIGAGKASDLKWIESCSRMIGEFARGKTIVVEKSTLPVKTAETIKTILESFVLIDKKNNKIEKNFSILSNPEFLAEGTAISDLEDPDRILIGGENIEAINCLKDIYLRWISEEKILTTDLWSSELSKLIANAFLAQRISSINSVSALCESTQSNVNDVAIAIGMDSRIGRNFLKPGPGFGGSCFKKDILNLIYICNHYGLEDVARYWEQVVLINNWQQKRISRIVVERMFGTISNKKIAIFGFAFKSNTNDSRESPAINICLDLLEEGCELSIFDPKVSPDKIKMELEKNKEYLSNIVLNNGQWRYFESMIEAVEGADSIIILTDWDEFFELNYGELISKMRMPSWIFDTRNVINVAHARSCGFNVWQLGNGTLN